MSEVSDIATSQTCPLGELRRKCEAGWTPGKGSTSNMPAPRVAPEDSTGTTTSGLRSRLMLA